MNSFAYLAALILVICHTAQAAEITYFGNNIHTPINAKALASQGINVSVYNLDAPRNFEKSISQDLPYHNVEKAVALAKQRLRNHNSDDMGQIFYGVLKAKQWDIKQLPAIVFGEGESVVYGVSDVNHAYQLYLRWVSEK